MKDSVKETNDTKFWHGLFRSFCLLFIHPWKDDPQNGIKIIGEIYSTTPYHIHRYLPSNHKTMNHWKVLRFNWLTLYCKFFQNSTFILTSSLSWVLFPITCTLPQIYISHNHDLTAHSHFTLFIPPPHLHSLLSHLPPSSPSIPSSVTHPNRGERLVIGGIVFIFPNYPRSSTPLN